MGFNPLKEKGISMEEQVMNWGQLNVKPYDKDSVDPYTRTRVILMNGIEVEAAIFGHQFARHTDNYELKQKLALVRRIEQEQQKAVNWMIPANESVLEVTLGYEQVAVDLTAYLARTEPDQYVKQALDFALLEDFDHLYRYSNLMQLTDGKEPSAVTKQYTEITVGRPTSLEHRYPFDDVRNHIHNKTAEMITKLHILTIVAAEQQTMNFYMNIGNRPSQMVGRGLYQEIGQVEEQHVTHYESLMDPTASWFERLLLHEYNEFYLYYSLMHNEPLQEARDLWERNMRMEIEHIKAAGELLKQYENRDPAEIIPDDVPELFRFESNVGYIRDVLASQYNYNAMNAEFVPADRMPSDYRYYRHQDKVNAGGAPSSEVIEKVVEKQGTDYRQELAGPHPVEAYRQKAVAR